MAHRCGAYPRKITMLLTFGKQWRIPWRISCCLAGAYLLANNLRRIPWRILLAHTSGAYSEKQRETERERQREKERYKERERQRDREIQERQRERERQRDRDIESDIDKQMQKDRL